MKINSAFDLGVCWRHYNITGEGRHSRKKGNVSFQYQTLFSRQTPIAKFYKNKQGEPFILVQAREYSFTTNRQIDKCVQRYTLSFRVPNIGAQGGWSSEKWMEPTLMHECNLHYLAGLVREFELAAIKGWMSTRYFLRDEYWRRRLQDLHDRVFTYAFHADVPVKMDSAAEIVQRIEQGRAKKREAYQHPAKVRQRERARVRRLAKQALGL